MEHEYLIIPFIGLVALLVFVFFDAFKGRKEKQSKLHDDVSNLLDSYDEAIWEAYKAQKSELSSVFRDTVEATREELADSKIEKLETAIKKDLDEVIDKLRKDTDRLKSLEAAFLQTTNLARAGNSEQAYLFYWDDAGSRASKASMREKQIHKRRFQRGMTFKKPKIYMGKPIDEFDEQNHYRIIKIPRS